MIWLLLHFLWLVTAVLALAIFVREVLKEWGQRIDEMEFIPLDDRVDCPLGACDGTGRVENLDSDGYPSGYFRDCPCRMDEGDNHIDL